MTLIIFIIVALFAFALALDLSWSNLLSAQRNDLVFEDRFKGYGAYRLRKENHKTILLAMFLTFGGVSIFSILLIPDEIKKQVVIFKDLVTPLIDPPIFEEISQAKKEEKTTTSEKPSQSSQSSSQQGNSTPLIVDKGATNSSSNTGGTPDGDPTELHNPTESPIGSKGSGTSTGIDSTSVGPPIYDFVEQSPLFPGGEKAFQKFITSNIEYPEWEKNQGKGGRLYMSFVVMPDGSIGQISTVRAFPGSAAFEKEAKRVLSKMPKWTPGKMGKNNVAVRLNIPLDFHVR